MKLIALGLLLLFSSVSGVSYADAQQASAAYMRQYFVSFLKKPFDEQDTRRKLLVIGDSHAQDLLNALHEVNALENMQISTRYVPTRCQLSLSDTQAEHYLPADRKLCESSDHLSLMQVEKNQGVTKASKNESNRFRETNRCDSIINRLFRKGDYCPIKTNRAATMLII